VLVGYFVVQWTPNMTARFLIITLVALVDTLLFYDIFVRRTLLTRLLFGMKNRDVKPLTLTRLGLVVAVVTVTLYIIFGAGNTARNLAGRWVQTLDSTQQATGYNVEFERDNTWEVTAGDQSISGTYSLNDEGSIEFVYPDESKAVSILEMSADRFALFTQGSDRVQVFMRTR
jgi:hypothetical protein